MNSWTTSNTPDIFSWSADVKSQFLLAGATEIFSCRADVKSQFLLAGATEIYILFSIY